MLMHALSSRILLQDVVAQPRGTLEKLGLVKILPVAQLLWDSFESKGSTEYFQKLNRLGYISPFSIYRMQNLKPLFSAATQGEKEDQRSETHIHVKA